MTCLLCDKNFNKDDIEKVDIFPEEEGLCLRCIIDNLPLDKYICFENICKKCDNTYDYWKVYVRGICIDDHLCEECHIKNMKITDCKNNRRRLCKNRECLICYNRSFAIKEQSIHTHYRSKNIPRYETCGGKNKIIFCCEKGHVFIKGVRDNTWCAECSGKKQKKLKDYQNIAIKMGGVF